MPKKKRKNRNKKEQDVNISNVEYLDMSILNITEIDKSEKITKNDLLVVLTTSILNQSDLPEQPMSCLEQLVCQNLREVTSSEVLHFKDFYTHRFKQFLEQNASHFSLRQIENTIFVSKVDKRETQEEATPPSACVTQGLFLSMEAASHIAAKVQPANCRLESLQSDRAQFDQDVDYEEQKDDTGDVEESQTLMCTKKPTFHSDSGQMFENDDAIVQHLLSQKEDDLHIFKRSSEDYTRNRVQFTIDIASLWNTPYRQRAYIVLGVKPRTPTPHALVGLRSSTKPEVYYNLVLNHLFNFKPKFTYREVLCRKKLVGILEMCSNHGEGFPSIVHNDDCKPYLCTNQLWIRRQGKSIVLPPTDPSYTQVHLWFGQLKSSLADAESTTKLVEQNTSNTKSPHQQRKKSEDSAIDKTLAAPPSNVAGSCAMGDIERLMTSLKNFRKGHFVLVCGRINMICKNIDALSTVPWIAVYDFDFHGRDTGLLNRMEDGIKQRRNLSVSSWCDPPTGITEKGTQWWSLRGRRDIPESLTSYSSHSDWFKCVREKLEKLCICLAQFSEDYTVLTVLVLWPSSEFEARCMYKFLSRLQEYTQPQVILCFSDPDKRFPDSPQVEMLTQDFGESLMTFNVPLHDLCCEVERLSLGDGNPTRFQYQLPSSDGKQVTVSASDAAWLTQDLEVLYLESSYTKRALTAEDLHKEAEEFFRGGTLNWYALYDIGPGYLDVERGISNKIVKHIRSNHIDEYKPGRITVLHAPGAGGSTMAQRILWDLHTIVPCAQIKLRSGSSMEDLANRMNFLHDKTLLPVIALIDGEDEPRLKQLCLHLNSSYVVIFHVKRYPHQIDESNLRQGSFYLMGEVTEQESRNLVLRFTKHCDKTEKKDKLDKLDNEVRNGKMHYMFEYGMTVYNHEFKGIQSFVRGYLWNDNTRKELEPWQKYLGFLALVHYYGQSSMPCQFFACLLPGRGQNQPLEVQDLPFAMRVFIVPDTNEARGSFIRICHYIIAKEILEQILHRGERKHRSRSSNSQLSKEAKLNLKDFCIDFISQSAKRKPKTSLTAQTITSILARTFIFRENTDVSDIEKKRKPQFSQIMYDLDQKTPYHGRLQVLEALCNMFPDDPNFKAHLARFYACCRPEEEQKAEDLFKEALTLCNKRRCNEHTHDRTKGREHRDDDEGLTLTLMHIYHMYGMLFQRRIAKYTGRNPEDGPQQPTDENQFQKRLDEIVQNAKQACYNFMCCREYTPRGHEDCYQYINEINVRLQTCEFVRRFFKGGMAAYLSERKSGKNFENFDFIRESVTEIEDLIMECYNVVLLDIHDNSLRKAVLWYAGLFQGCSDQLRALVVDDSSASRRLELIAKKLEFPRRDNFTCVDVPDVPAEKIKSLVEMLERIFDHEKMYNDSTKSKLELDYKDWLLAIRNPSFPKVYKLEEVVFRVRHWHDSVHSPQSAFYLFILLSLLGFGSVSKKGECPMECIRGYQGSYCNDCCRAGTYGMSCNDTCGTCTEHGNNESLVEAQMLREDMQKLSKLVVRPRCPREWLGRDDLEGIRRLVSNNAVGHVDNRRVKSGSSRAKLAVCKGTIRPKNKKVAGEITLDLGENCTPVHVFYVPILNELEGSRYAGERVQFHLAFTLENGYDAYEVKLLDRYRCNECSTKVEMTLDQEEITCHCGSTVMKNEHAMVSRNLTDEDS